MAPRKTTETAAIEADIDSGRYGNAVHIALLSVLLNIMTENGLKETTYQTRLVDALNSIGLPGDAYTWEGTRKASVFSFPLSCCFPGLALLAVNFVICHLLHSTPTTTANPFFFVSTSLYHTASAP